MKREDILLAIATFVFLFATTGNAVGQPLPVAGPIVTLSTTASLIFENGGVTQVTATLSATSAETVTVTLGKKGTATDTADYVLDNTITILPGSQKGSLSLTALDDTLDEPNETAIFSIAAVRGGGATGSADQKRTVIISDDDLPPTVTLSVNPTSIFEQGGVATLTATLNLVSGQTVIVNLVKSGTASTVKEIDYTLSEEAITIPAGKTEGSITLTAVDDRAIEPNETVMISISTVKNAKPLDKQPQTINIIDDDLSSSPSPPPASGVTLEVDKTEISEKGGVATIKARRKVASAQSVTVNLTRTGTATVGSDYEMKSTQIIIPSGRLFGAVLVKAKDDTLVEPDETVILAISGVQPAGAFDDKKVTITIKDKKNDETTPTVTLLSRLSTILENGGSTLIEAILSAPSRSTITVPLVIEGGTASSSDFKVSDTKITIPAGKTRGSVQIKAIDDKLYEGDETVIIFIPSVIGPHPRPVGTITIKDDEPTPKVSLSVDKKRLKEDGDRSSFRIQLSGKSAFDTSVTLGGSGTATHGKDYQLEKTVTIPSGSTVALMELTPIDDDIHEEDETVIVEIESTGPNAVKAGIPRLSITITDDDPFPTVTLSVDPIGDDPFPPVIVPGNPIEIPENGGSVVIRATTKPRSSKEIKVILEIDPGSPEIFKDFTLSSTTIIIPPESESGTVTLTAVDDNIPEETGTVIINIRNVIGARSDQKSIIISILDDDAATGPIPLHVTTGDDHGCALFSDGLIECLGDNTFGQLGNGSTTATSTPVTVSNISKAIQVSAGAHHTCALLENGEVKCWGMNLFSPLDVLEIPTPVAVDIKNAIQITSGHFHTCVLFTEGTVKCWGRNLFGQLGNGSMDDSPSPVSVSNITTAIQIEAGGGHTCARIEKGTAQCWGANTDGQLGIGNNVGPEHCTDNLPCSKTPIAVSGIQNAKEVSLGDSHTCALLSDGTVKCWGNNIHGQLGNNSKEDSFSPSPVSNLSTVTQISASFFHTCARLSDSTASCWGKNDFGQLGNSTTKDAFSPEVVPDLTRVIQVSAGHDYTCAIVDDTIQCWGREITGTPTNTVDITEAKQLTIEATGALTAPKEIYNRVATELAAIRVHAPEVEHVRRREANRLTLGFDEEGANAIRNHTYTAWNDLNSLYRVTEIYIGPFFDDSDIAGLKFEEIYNIPLIAKEYAKLPHIEFAGPEHFIGDGDDICLEIEGENHFFIFDEGSGDCPSGCIRHIYRGFRVNARGEITSLGAWDTKTKTAKPDWLRNRSSCTAWLK